jgi:hypothetical protein
MRRQVGLGPWEIETGGSPKAVDRDDRGRGPDGGYGGSDQPLDEPAVQRRGSEQSAAPGHPDPDAASDRGREHYVLERERGPDGQHDRQPTALAVDLLAELAASRAFAQVPADVRSPQRAAPKVRELGPDLGAIGLACGAAGEKRLTCLEHEGLDLLPGNTEDVPDLLVAKGVELGENQRSALIVGKPAHVEH